MLALALTDYGGRLHLLGPIDPSAMRMIREMTDGSGSCRETVAARIRWHRRDSNKTARREPLKPLKLVPCTRTRIIAYVGEHSRLSSDED
ncbi:hypothetical protein CEXT_322791 [Caerostris extrusa]|uniref:Uncharacterized protein n=1 Tax=Caerostris extrusa TaxID=172846 RepID=A0AAV4Y4T3_CAEEX|nr:hypothetical protein CEXT_322791 [Caerostris extrusa]